MEKALGILRKSGASCDCEVIFNVGKQLEESNGYIRNRWES